MANAIDEQVAASLARGEPAVVDAWLGSQRASALRLELLALLEQQSFRPAGVGAKQDRIVAPQIRRDSVCWFDERGATGVRPGAEVSLFLARLEGLKQHLNETCYLGLHHVECHAACFEPGAFYGAHMDVFAADARRVISYCYYLNDAWSEAAGGCLRLHGEAELDVAPVLDRLVVFGSAEVLHEVLPTAVRRLSLTGWLSRL